MYQHPSIVNPVRIYITHIVYLSQINDKVNIFYMALYLFNSKNHQIKRLPKILKFSGMQKKLLEIFVNGKKVLGNLEECIIQMLLF